MNNKTIPELDKKDLLKFIFLSFIGIVTFLVPFPVNGGINTILGVLSNLIKEVLSGYSAEILLLLTSASTICSIIDRVATKKGKNINSKFHKIFAVDNVYLVTKIFALIICLLYCLDIGPKILIGEDTGESMIGLGKTLVAIAISLSFFLPFLTDSGLMEFVGVITRPFVRPLFKVPSDASLDLVVSWMGASSAAVILSAEKYHRGYYNKREAAIVMCNFSLVSIPFCMLIAGAAKIETYFPVMYALVCVLGILLAVILPRIYPLNKISEDYYNKKVDFQADVSSENMGVLRHAVIASSNAAGKFSLNNLISSGLSVFIMVCFTLVPIVIAWGTVGLILVEYTPIFTWLSIPIQVLLETMGVVGASVAAPATLAGFIDMFIPGVLIQNVASIETRFIIATLSLIQIIYITEVGAVIIQTKVGVGWKKLFLIFLERTLISLPIIVLVAKLIF